MKEEDEDFTPDEQDERSDSPSPSKAARSRTPLRQSRIPVPKTASKVGSNLSRKSSEDPGHLARTAIPTSTQRPQHSVKRAEAIAHNAGIFATQRGVVQNKVASGIPASTPMSKSRSSPSKTQLADGFSGPQSPSAPRYAQPTAASMSKSMSQPLFGTNYTSRSMPSHPQHQYAAYAHIQHPLPMSPKQNGNASNAFEQMMNSTPSKGQQSAYANISPPDVSLIAPISAEMQNNGTRTQSMAKVSGGRPVHQRSHTSQPALSSGPASTPSRMPSVRRSKTTPQQSSPSNDITSLAIPDGFVISGKLYPAENVEEAMKAYKAATSIGTTQRPATRMASNHSTGSNGPVQELSMPAALPFYGQQQQQQQQQAQPQLQYLSQPAQNYVIGIAPDGQQIPLIISQPQNVPSYTSWQNVPAFMPPSAQATPSTGYTYDFSQPLDTQQNFGFNTLYTPNTANSNMSNMPSSTALWFPQQDSANQGADFSQYLISNESFNNGTSPTFLVNDANGQQQEYVLGGPSVELTSATGFAQLQDPTSWTAA